MPLLVRASNGIGSVAVALEDSREALRSIDELKEAGFKKIGIYDLTGREIDLAQLRRSAGQDGAPEALEHDDTS